MQPPYRLLPCLSALVLLAACERQSPAAPGTAGTAITRATVTVELAAVERRPIARSLQAIGSLRSDESAVIAAEIAGRIVRIGFQEGQPVAAGRLLFALEDSVYRAQLAQASASAELARRNQERAQELFRRKLISAQERDELAAQQAVTDSAVQLAQAQLDKTRIVAPFDGVAGLRQAGLGDYVTAGQQLTNFQSLQRMKVDFRIPESALSQIYPGQGVQMEIEAWPGEAFVGEIYAIDPQVAEATRSVAVRARLPNPQGKLRPGLFARVRVTLRSEEGLLIPEQAVFPRGDQQYVYTVREGKAELQALRLGQRSEGQVEVLAGLDAGDEVVVSGLQQLAPGTPVRSGL